MGLMGTPRGRKLMIQGAQTRPALSKNGAERSRERFEPADRLSKPPRSLFNFSFGTRVFSARRAPLQSTRTPLAIDPYMPEIMDSFRNNQVVIVQAATGTGKSVGISEAIVKEGYQLIVTNPRRIGAVLLAEHLARRDGSPLGERFGYRHGRHKEANSDCQAIFTTEGYQLKAMLHELRAEFQSRSRNGEKLAIMWDEAHERTAYGVVLLALCKEMMLAGRDVKLVISSATIDPKPIVDYFAKDGIHVPVHSIPVEHYPITDVKQAPNSTIIDDIKGSPRSLTFDYGKSAIGSLVRDLALAAPELKAIPMHAELPQQEQQAALRRINHGEDGFAVISTNNLQASVTLNINRVNSTGLVRRQRFGEDGEAHLRIENSSQAEEQQKKGRAGRLGPGEWSYRGRVPFEELAQDIPHEIENCQLESLVLQAIAAVVKFSHLNRKLMVQAPDAHVEHAIERLKYLGLLGSSGCITELGEEVAKLPTEVRTGKALALACRYSEQQGLSPDELILPMIDAVACVEAKGIVTWESVSAQYRGEAHDYHARLGRWKRLLNRSYGSDPLAQMEIFRRLLNLPEERFHDWGIHVNHFSTARGIRQDLCEVLGLDPRPRAPSSSLLSPQQLRKLNEFYWAGSIDRLYRFVGKDPDDPRKSLYKPVVGEGRLRILSRDSVVEKGSFVVAEPITIDTSYLDDDPMRLLVMASAVDTTWLQTNTPAPLKNSVKEALEKMRRRKSQSEEKEIYRRQGGPQRRRG